jgi:hypothetical protein
MIQFIHVYLNITILYQGDAMQISNLVSQYNNSVANGEPMTEPLAVSVAGRSTKRRMKIPFSGRIPQEKYICISLITNGLS